MPDDASATGVPAGLTERVRFALESGDLDVIRDLLDPGARWGAPEGPNDYDCQNRDQVIEGKPAGAQGRPRPEHRRRRASTACSA